MSNSMRCVSKCFIGGRSLKVYFLLFLGTALGFTLSNIIQAINTDVLTSAALRLQRQEPYLSKLALESRGGVSFSNLRKESKEEVEEDIPNFEFGDYEYAEEVKGKEPGVAAERVHVEVPQAEGADPPKVAIPSLVVPEAVKLKYQSPSWQGRNMMEKSDNNGLPPNKLSDELSMRQTVLIAVITSVTQLMTQTLAVQGTWAPQASQVIFFVGEVDIMPHLPHGMVVIELEGVADRVDNWQLKEISAIKYLMDHYLERTDWFMVIGDQTYVVTDHLENRLNKLDAGLPVYLGLAGDPSPNGRGLLCKRDPGIVYSRTLLEGLRPYLPACWPGVGGAGGGAAGEEQGGGNSLNGCIGEMGVKCTQAKETQELFLADAKVLVESPTLFSQPELRNAVAIHPVHYPKYMYRLHSYYQELRYNVSVETAKSAEATIQSNQPFIPSHLRSSFRLHPPTTTTPQTPPTTKPTPPASKSDGGVVIRPRHVPKNKFEINSWEYFNQTRLMSIMHESPARGIIGGLREEARYGLTKAIYLANQGVPQSQRYIFDKLENGYHRVDPMRGSEFILDFVFRRQSDRNVRIKKRLSILRPFHETIVPVETSEMLPTVNFLVTLSGLSNRLEHFLSQYERNVLQLGQDATLTIVLFESPDAPKVRMMVQQYLTRYQGAKMSVIDVQGDFARGVGLDHGLSKFADDQLVFVVDVDLDISTEFLQRCRLNTVKGQQVYFPVFFKLYNQDFVNRYHRGNSSLLISRSSGHWAHYSYGMQCIYAGDYRKAGGYDISMHGWGEEDVDFLSKVLKARLEVFRAPDPGLIHNWHPKICSKQKVTNPSAYEHCLQSKGENLADRIELAQYVFQNELNKGNVL